MQRGENRRQRQFFNNLDNILGEYENGRMDDPDTFVNMTASEWIEYVKYDIYDLKSDGHGHTVYRDKICGDLRFLGNAWIDEQIINEVRNEGWLIEE